MAAGTLLNAIAASAVTVKVAVRGELKPLASVAVHVTVVWPIAKVDPDAGAHATTGGGPGSPCRSPWAPCR